MGTLYTKSLDKYKNYFKQSAKLLGIDVSYRYIIDRKTELATGESEYSKLSEPIICSVIIERGNPEVESLKQLGWFVDMNPNQEQILVDFSVDTPNLQEGCRFTIASNENEEQNKEYVVIKMSSKVLYPTCIKCLCQPVLENESRVDCKNNIEYGQQDITSDDVNYTYINEEKELKFF